MREWSPSSLASCPVLSMLHGSIVKVVILQPANASECGESSMFLRTGRTSKFAARDRLGVASPRTFPVTENWNEDGSVTVPPLVCGPQSI